MRYQLDVTTRLHERLLEIVRTALPLITASVADADLIGLTHLREEMVQAMELYGRHVHRLRDKADEAGDAAGMAAASRLVAGSTQLAAFYAAFRDRWARRQAMENWHEYRLSAIVMMKQVRAGMQAAEQLRHDRARAT